MGVSGLDKLETFNRYFIRHFSFEFSTPFEIECMLRAALTLIKKSMMQSGRTTKGQAAARAYAKPIHSKHCDSAVQTENSS